MTKEELFKMMNEHPVMYVATNENGQPHVRAILMFKADADGIVFHTGVTKDLYRQLLADPRSEVCFSCGKYQVRVEGRFELVEEMALKEEIVNHPLTQVPEALERTAGRRGVLRILEGVPHAAW